MMDICEVRQAAARAAPDPRQSVGGESGGAKSFDIYLVHALADDDLVAGVRQILEERGHRVCVDCDSASATASVSSALATCVADMRRCSAMFFVYQPHLAPSDATIWKLGHFEGMMMSGPRPFLLPVMKKGEIGEVSGLLARYETVDLATYEIMYPPRSRLNWLRRLIGNQYPELACRPPF